MLKALSLADQDPTLARRQAAAERAAYSRVLRETGLFARLADHGEAMRFSVDELIDLAPLDLDALAPASRREWENSLNLAGQDIPYHPSWRKAYPEVVATYPYKQLLDLINRDIERWEQAYPFFFSAVQGGQQLIYDTLAAAHNSKLNRLLKQAEAYHASLLERAQWLASRPGDNEEPLPEPPRELLYTQDIPGWRPPPVVEWAGSKTDLVELAYALLESGILKATNGRARAIEALASMFNLTLGKPERHLQTIKKRRLRGGMTSLLDNAREALTRFLDNRNS